MWEALTDSILTTADCKRAFTSIARDLGRLLEPKPNWNVWQWAEHKRWVGKGVSAKTQEGAKLYSTADAPHQRAPQESVTDPAVQITVLVMASQIGGKTEICNNVIGYHMDHAPRNCVIMYPTIDSAEKYSKRKFAPMAAATPALSAILKPARSRDSGNTILSKDFLGGSVYFVGANSAPSLRGASGAVLLGDEIDSIDINACGEGDPVELLWRRGESFKNVVKVLASTPTLKGASAIWKWFELSDQQYWLVPCPKCGTFQQLKWTQIQWPEGKPEQSVLVCSSCAAALDDKQRLEMYFNGQWRASAPFKGIRGYHLNGIYCPWPAQKGFEGRLHQMVVDSIRAQESTKKKMVWTNTFLCEPFEEESSEPMDVGPLLKRGENYTPQSLPNDIILVLATVDVQKTWLQVQVTGLGLDEETWGIESKTIEGDPEQDDVWQDLADVLSGSYTRADGLILPITAAAIDMRHKPTRVVRFVQKSGLPRIYPIYGVAGGQTLLVTTRFSKHYRLRTYAVDTKMAKDAVFSRLAVEDPGPRYMHFPAKRANTDVGVTDYGFNPEFFAQLTAEVLRTRYNHGYAHQFYEKIRDRNEALDLSVYFLAAVDILRPNLTAISKRQKPPGQDGTPPVGVDYPMKPPPSAPGPAQTPQQPQQPQRAKMRIGNW